MLFTIFIIVKSQLCYYFTHNFVNYCLQQCPIIILQTGQFNYQIQNSFCVLLNPDIRVSTSKFITLFTWNNQKFWLTTMTDNIWWKKVNNQLGKRCPVNCVKCIRSFICQQCFRTHILKQGNCIISKQNVLTYDEFNMELSVVSLTNKKLDCLHKDCNICDLNCQNCIIIGNQQCILKNCNNYGIKCYSCIPQFNFLEGACQCKIKTYYYRQQCIPCPQNNCQSCVIDRCIKCQQDFVLVENKTCQCSQGFYKLQNFCFACQQDCQLCLDLLCFKCRKSFLLNQNNCLCPSSTYEKNNTCNLCDRYCLQCDDKGCLKCQKLFNLNQGICICYLNLFQTKQTCANCYYPQNCKCQIGTFFSKNSCQKCVQNCQKCANINCLQCKKDSQLRNGKCMKIESINLSIILSVIGSLVFALIFVFLGFKFGFCQRVKRIVFFRQPLYQIQVFRRQNSQHIISFQSDTPKEIQQVCFCFNSDLKGPFTKCQSCNHFYHKKCLKVILKTDERCPYCRKKFNFQNKEQIHLSENQ